MPWAFFAGAAVGVLGGRIGLGGAEFRLPLLIGVFGIAAFAAVIMNKAMSLIVVLSALPAQLVSVPWSQVSPHWPVVVNLLAGSLVGPGSERRGQHGCARSPYIGCWRRCRC
jgi:uncharacterized protein